MLALNCTTRLTNVYRLHPAASNQEIFMNKGNPEAEVKGRALEPSLPESEHKSPPITSVKPHTEHCVTSLQVKEKGSPKVRLGISLSRMFKRQVKTTMNNT